MNNFLKVITKNVSDFINHESVEQDISMICKELTDQAFTDLQPLIRNMIQKQIMNSTVKQENQGELDIVQKTIKKKSLLEQEIDNMDRQICYHIVKKDISEDEIARMTSILDDKKSDLVLMNRVISILE